MDGAQRFGKVRIGVAGEPVAILPFAQYRHALKRGVDRLAQRIGMQALGQRIDRIEEWQVLEPFRVHDAVGMHHLQMAVVKGGGARNVPHFADRIELLQIILARVEIGDRQRVGVVACLDIVGRARPMRRRRPVLVDRDRDRDDRVRRHFA